MATLPSLLCNSVPAERTTEYSGATLDSELDQYARSPWRWARHMCLPVPTSEGIYLPDFALTLLPNHTIARISTLCESAVAPFLLELPPLPRLLRTMTQLPDAAGLPANVTPEQLQAIMLYLAQNQVQIPVSGAQPPTSPASSTLSSLSSLSNSSFDSTGPGGPSPSSGPSGPLPLAGPGVPPQAAGADTGTGAIEEPPSRLKTPPPILHTAFISSSNTSYPGKSKVQAWEGYGICLADAIFEVSPAHARRKEVCPHSPVRLSAHIASATSRASPSSSNRKSRSRTSTSQPKAPLPTGSDPALTFEEPMAVDVKPLPGQASTSANASAPDGNESSDPFEGFPEIVTVPPKPADADMPAAADMTAAADTSAAAADMTAAADTSAAAQGSAAAGSNEPRDADMETDTPTRIRSSRYRPTMKRWINTRRTRSNSETSPPPTVKRSPKKKVRVHSPRRSPTRATVSLKKKKSGKKSPTPDDEQPSPVAASTSADVGPSDGARVSEDVEMPNVDEDAVRTLEKWLELAKQGRSLTEIGATFNNATPSLTVREDADIDKTSLNEPNRPARSRYIDDEAEESSQGQDGPDDGEDLDGFIVPDNVVEYDGDAPALPDDEDNGVGDDGEDAAGNDDDDDDDIPLTLTRLHRRSSASTQNPGEGNTSDVEIVEKVDKGKGRAVPLPTSFSSATVAPSAASVSSSAGPSGSPSRRGGPVEVPRDGVGSASGAAESSGNTVASGSTSGSKEPAWASLKSVTTLYPGSMAVDASANVCPRLQLDGNLFSYASHNYELFESIDFAVGVKPVPGGCAFISDFSPDGYGNPNVDLVAAAETNIHRKNLILGLMLRRQGCFINDATVDPAEVIAVQVSPAGSTLRYKSVLADTRAPAVSITPGVVRIWSLDTPTTNAHPVRFLAMTPLEALVDRFIGAQCMNFGQRELTVTTLHNAIRFATVPAFGRPTHPVAATSSSLSSSMRRNNAGPSMRRSVNFEPTTNDPIAVLDARHTKLPDDIGLWTTVLPRFEGPLPDNAVAFVAHTTSMWVGTRSTTAPSGMTYNVQHNLVFVVIIGELPAGYV
ncbi:hypothetical protein EV122DRAFT_282432 [Schizophyllum commune]